MYAERVQSIGGLCLTMPAEEASIEDYVNWLSEEVYVLLDVFSGVNENFAIVAIEGALALAGDSIDLEAVHTTASKDGAYILPTASGAQKSCTSHFNKMVAVVWLQVHVICYSHSTGKG
jgi:uncharacterized membrane protein